MKISFIYFLFLISGFVNLYAFGTYAEGRAIVLIKKLTSGGILYESFEGTLEIASYEESEECEDFENCFTPLKIEIPFSIRIENKETIKFLQQNLNKVVLIDYKIHRIESISLDSNFEILKAYPFKIELPPEFPKKFIVEKTGSRNFSFYGKILQLEYRGTVTKSYEGIYYDRKKDKIRPFSITNEEMAKYVNSIMVYTKEYHIGISRAIVKGLRETHFDIFEINYLETAGGVE